MQILYQSDIVVDKFAGLLRGYNNVDKGEPIEVVLEFPEGIQCGATEKRHEKLWGWHG